MNNELWGGKRYHTLNSFLREKFGQKVFKISIDGGFTCPNRDGKVSRGGCIFCSSHGSGDFAGSRTKSISDQFEEVKEVMHKKWHNGKFIAYFQAYTNTYASVDVLRKKYEEAINNEDVVALAIATRPDCLPDDVIELIAEMNEKVYTWVELGLQTSNEETATLINRGYTLDVFDDAVKRLRKKNIDVVAHCIFGLPGETEDDMISTVDYLAHSDIQGIKLHLLHLMKDTALVKLYEEGKLQFLDQDEYVKIICKAITRIPEDMIIHRLTGDAPRESLIGPMWSLKKWEVLNSIDDYMEKHDLKQGLYYHTNNYK